MARICFGITAIILFVCAAFVYISHDFYISAEGSSAEIYKFVWCFASSLLGFGGIAIHFRCENNNPFPDYFVIYVPHLLFLVVAVQYILGKHTSVAGYEFYKISFAACCFIGLYVDVFINTFRSTLPGILNGLAKRVGHIPVSSKTPRKKIVVVKQ